MLAPVVVELKPEAIYTTDALGDFGLSAAALRRARLAGKLRFTRQGNKTLYLGRWLLDWLESESEPREVANAS
jgi:hypothetical protein